jgi:hypothetical protein
MSEPARPLDDAPVSAPELGPAPYPTAVAEVTEAIPEVGRQGESIFWRRLRKFRRITRGYWSFLLITGAYVVSFLLPGVMNRTAGVERYEGEDYLPPLR